MFTSVKPELMGSKVILLFWVDYLHLMHSMGFKYSYGRCSNVKTFHIGITYFEAEDMSKVKMVQEGKELTLSFIRYRCRPATELKFLSDSVKLQAKL
jgi:hypothetical protein